MDTGLPIEDVVGEVRSALAAPGLAVLVAAPGAGKTTVVPLRLLDEPWAAAGRIVVLEPRRVATRAAARRMAHLLGEEVGDTVGYSTRDDRRVSRSTRIEVVTDGILTRRLQRDPELPGVAALLFDEFHERRLQSDLGLALALDVRRSLRPELRLLVMSATLDAEAVASLLGRDEPAPIVRSEGRQHPVEIRWRPVDLPPGRRTGRALGPPAAGGVQAALGATEGDVLVFLPGMAEQRATAEALGRPGPEIDVRLLHGSLPAAEQDAAIEPSPPGRRKVVLSTDIAETSLTVEGVTAVVDAGMERRPAFDPRTGLTRIVTVAAARSSAEQRAGRAGRTAPGVAFRLWSEGEHAARAAHPAPEIAAVDLAGLLLEVKAWGAELAELALLDPPPAASVAEARELLRLLGALDLDHRLTDTGRAMVGAPLHPRLAAVVGQAPAAGREQAIAIAALLSERDVLTGRPGDVPADLAIRLRVLDGRGPRGSKQAVATVRRRTDELRRRLRGVEAGRGGGGVPSAGILLAAGYPDRVAVRRAGQRGRFLLRNGTGARVEESDPLADTEALVVADVDGWSPDARIRIAAALTLDELEQRFAEEVETVTELVWDAERDDLVERTERRLGAIVLGRGERLPEAGPPTTAALAEVVRERGFELLAPGPAARRLQQRLEFLHREVGEDWPAVGDDDLLADLDQWFGVVAGGARRRADLERVAVADVLRARMAPHHHAQLDDLAPERFTLPSGRSVEIDYGGPQPTVRARVQEVFGLTDGPRVAGGRVPVLFDLRSPADRTLQRTADLAGFWAGSWREVRKEMAGRYPKHDWPEEPREVPERNRRRTRRTGT